MVCWGDGFIDLCTQHGKLAEYTAAHVYGVKIGI